MDSALLLAFGGIAAVFALIPDQKAPPALPAPAAAPAAVAAVPAPEPENDPYVAAPDFNSDSSSFTPRQADDDDTMSGQSPDTSGPAASMAARRAQSLNNEAAYQAQYRGD
jgi:hypothetical protein